MALHLEMQLLSCEAIEFIRGVSKWEVDDCIFIKRIEEPIKLSLARTMKEYKQWRGDSSILKIEDAGSLIEIVLKAKADYLIFRSPELVL